MSSRRAHLDAASEDDILRLQAEWATARGAPCAAAVAQRVVGDGGGAANAGAQPSPLLPAQGPACTGCDAPGPCEEHALGHRDDEPGAAPILGAVRERDVTARAAGRRPTRLPAGAGGTAPPPAAAAFPQATHRRVSKVRDGGRE